MNPAAPDDLARLDVLIAGDYSAAAPPIGVHPLGSWRLIVCQFKIRLAWPARAISPSPGEPGGPAEYCGGAVCWGVWRLSPLVGRKPATQKGWRPFLARWRVEWPCISAAHRRARDLERERA
jgi:hypothetical protein